ncbi:DUF6168 family protein [Yeosuana sp. AK3]
MRNPFSEFIVKAIILFFFAFFIHVGVLNVLHLPLFDNKIILSYIINLILIMVVFGSLYLLKNKYRTQLGFLFLAGSFLKFAVFFIVFYPFYKQDHNISNLEFASFFVPYALGLILETISLSKWLNKL